MPFQLKEDRSLRAIINQCIKLLEWSPIDVISKEKFDLSEFLITHKIYSIERIIAPKLSRREFMVYADEIKSLMKKKIVGLEKDKSRLKEDKVKALLLCKTFAWEMEHRYNANNVFSLGNDFQWRIHDGNTFVAIPFSNIDITAHHRFVAEEFALRMYFFQWVRVRFESALFELDVRELPDPLVEWKEEGAKLKIAEMMYALQKSELFEFCNDDSKQVFRRYIEKLFSLGPTNWSELEADIRKRRPKDGKTKWYFLNELSKLNT